MPQTTGKGRNHSQNPLKCANLLGLLLIAPISQYAVVCHIESNSPQHMYRNILPTYGRSKMSILWKVGERTIARVYSLFNGQPFAVAESGRK